MNDPELVVLGEVMLRLDPREERIRSARRFEVNEGGGEYNVGRAVRSVFGIPVRLLTAWVDNPVGRLICRRALNRARNPRNRLRCAVLRPSAVMHLRIGALSATGRG